MGLIRLKPPFSDPDEYRGWDRPEIPAQTLASTSNLARENDELRQQLAGLTRELRALRSVLEKLQAGPND